MPLYDSYTFDLAINGKVQEIDPINYSFSIRDSIHKLYPSLTFQLNDVTGLFQEVLGNTEGIPIKIKYGIETKNVLSCPFVLINDQLPNTHTNDSIGGRITVNGIHEYYTKQEVIGEAYNNLISKIIRIFAGEYNFSSVVVNDTGCQNIWYRPLMNQRDFIKEILLPNSFSYNSQETPFFCFIDSNNEFHFRNYNSMVKENPIKSITQLNFAPSPDIDENYTQGKNRLEDGTGDRFIFDFKRWKPGSTVTKKLWNRKLFQRDLSDGSYSESEDHIYNYPKNEYRNLLIFDESSITSSYDLLYKETETGLIEAQKGRKINSMKDSFFLERFILTVPLDVTLRAGRLIEINLPIKEQENTVNSLAYSGQYLIESSDHVWNNRSMFGYTQLIISRKFVTVPNTSLIKSKLMVGS